MEVKKGKGKIKNEIRIGIKLSGWEKWRKYGKKIFTKIQTKVWRETVKGSVGERKKITNEIEKFRKRKVGENGGGLEEKDGMVVEMTKL